MMAAAIIVMLLIASLFGDQTSSGIKLHGLT